jgi:ABC-type transport system involved in multi-copper enzyme maturation permease subunit
MFSVVLAIGAAFLAAPAIAGDVESGLVLAMLPRPVRRSDVVLGKWLGLAALLVAFTTAVGAIEFALIYRITAYVPPHPGKSIAFLIAESIVLLTLGLFLSTRLAPMTGGIVAVVLFGIAWVAGIAQSLGLVFHNQQLVSATTAISLIVPTDGLWRAAAFNLEPALLAVAAMTDVNRQSPFLVGAPPPPAYLVWTAGWIVALLVASIVSFNRRDL